jgi:threonylcarbamoyladenosine tRNA methylthiotransferase MtaB
MPVEVVTFGCRLNAYESEVIRQEANAAGLSDAIIVNTCAVTHEAVAQGRQTIRRLRKDQPGKRIIVTGCAAQTESEMFAAMPEVDAVLGNQEKLSRGSYVKFLNAGNEGPKVFVGDIMLVRDNASHIVDAAEGRARAFVQVQNGCDHRCTFCTIPFGRGNSRSVPMGAVVEEARRLNENGYNEIILTGVDLTSYGADLPGAPKLGRLVRAILKHVPELARLRLSSIDSIEADDALINAFANESRLMPHLHLSLQAGDDMILKRMKRRHLRKDSIEFCARLKKLRPDIVFGADLIAGFPTETEEMFENSLHIVDECELTHLHVFPFSPRKGTPAARMPQLPKPVIKERAARLREKGGAAFAKHLRAQVGTKNNALVEHNGRARIEQFTPIRIEHDFTPGHVVPVKITGENGRHLIGEHA